MCQYPTRYAAHRPFPSHAFVPGRTPRHARNARDECEGRERVEALAPERWREDEDYLFGVDLYNAGFLWEAHEAWEGPWRASARAEQRLLLQALIQLAAACLQLEMSQRKGAATLGRAALAKLRALPSGELMGLEPRALAAELERFLAGDPPDAAGRPCLRLRANADALPRDLA